MKVGFLGCGRVAQHYKKILLDMPPISDFDLKGVCDVDEDRARSFASSLGCNSYGSLESMLSDNDLEVVFILTPSGNHYEHAKKLLANGVNVVCEKPTAMRVEEILDLIELSKAANKYCATVFQNRWNPAVSAVLEAVKKDRFGKIVTSNIKLHWCRFQEYYEDGWHGTWLLDGGVINQQAIHHIDALRILCGPVARVCASKANRINKLDAEDTMVAILEYENGALGTVEVTTAARPRDFEASLSIVGDVGYVKIGGVALNKIEAWHFSDNCFPSQDEAFFKYSEDVPNGYGLSHHRFLSELVASHKNGVHPRVTLEDSCETTSLIHALYASSESGNWVSLKDKPQSRYLGIK